MSKTKYKKQWQKSLDEYIMAVSWSINGDLAIASARGEVMVKRTKNDAVETLLDASETNEHPVGCVAFSPQGELLAVGTLDGKLRVWQVNPEVNLVEMFEFPKQWIENVHWHPSQPILAFSFGHYVQVWDAQNNQIIATLPFPDSSVLDLQWHPTGEYLAMAGNGGIHIWTASDWDEDPFIAEMQGACSKIGWSGDGNYLAGNCFDNSVWIWCWENLETWHLSGFGGKIRNITWSTSSADFAPLLAISCFNGVILWKKAEDDNDGWASLPLQAHDGIIESLMFHPQDFSFVSADDEGVLFFWNENRSIQQRFIIENDGFSAIAWHPDGTKLVAGSRHGKVIIWQQQEEKKGKGFA
ncbi:High-affnity carbon uptake protein Hat/HatR [Cyanobacterium sp. HL-69]|uniref:WD40 repeat domain-containing protein n=1 Tax=Cyanobacterium sp. HL-69 TaxID=2054282 RepID=UPI000CA311C5|nr:High-affnity carbon uptake protein Hat/HatR [Cyanobacterium sp. HL-69]